MVKGLHLAVLLLSAWQSYAWINGGDYSKQFEQCSGDFVKGAPNDFSGGKYEQQCTDLLIPIDGSHQRIGNFSDEQMNYIQSLFRQMFSEAQTMNTMTNRVKRHVGYGGGMEVAVPVVQQPIQVVQEPIQVVQQAVSYSPSWRYRQDIRSQNGRPFHVYAEAVRKLKQKGRYDTLAQIHVTVIQTAHFGPNFLAWHRLYLLVVETALNCPVPYWDSTEDFVLKDPTKSVVWGPNYFGNGYGPVKTGPFAKFQWPGGPLFRKINAYGSLLDRPSIYKYILSQTRLAQISTPHANVKSNAEGYHNSVHAWVNGLMGNLGYSAYDPIFFTLHAMIDCVWELFRKNQWKNGIDPASDVVYTKLPGQSPYDKARLENFKNIAGYSNGIARMVRYEVLSECPYCDNSVDKYCDKNRGICVSATRQDSESLKGLAAADAIAKSTGLSSGRWGGAFSATRIDKRVRKDPVQPIY